MALILIIHFLNPDVLTFCVSLDYLDVLLCIHICLMGFAVCWFNVVSEVTYFGCCVVAFITWVGHFSVDWLNVFSEMIFFNGGEILFIVSFSKLWFITKSLGENDNKTIAILRKYEHTYITDILTKMTMIMILKVISETQITILPTLVLILYLPLI